MIINVEKLTIKKEELTKIDYSNPYVVISSFIQSIVDYNPADENLLLEKLQQLIGPYQEISELMKQNIKDRMLQNDKYLYIGKSYFIGATPENDYTPTEPYQIEVKENPYTDIEEGYKRLFVKSGGADSDRPITVRLAKDGKYYLWSDSFMGLLSDIRKPEKMNPWA